MARNILDRCPRCKKYGVRQKVNVFVDCPASQRSLNKQAIRKRSVLIDGVGWPEAAFYCPKCGWYQGLSK